MTSNTYEGATQAQLRHPQVQHFLAIHNMFRLQLEEMLRYTETLLAGQPRLTKPEINLRYQTLAQAAYQYNEMLHMHHHIETSNLFPVLHEEGLADEVVASLVAEHDEIAKLITQLDLHIANVATLDLSLVDADLRRLAEGLRAHLAYEETHVCPFLAHFAG